MSCAGALRGDIPSLLPTTLQKTGGSLKGEGLQGINLTSRANFKNF